MSTGLLCLILVALAAVGYVAGQRRAVTSASGDIRVLHSLPAFYGRITALMAAVPALVLVVVWVLVQPVIIEQRAFSLILPSDIPEGSSPNLVIADVRRLAEGLTRIEAAGGNSAELARDPVRLKAALLAQNVVLGNDPTASTIVAAVATREMAAQSQMILTVLSLLVAVAGAAWALSRINPEFRARNATEKFSMVLLIGCSLIAVLTTAGIVLSMLSETLHFFRLYPVQDFFFSLKWNPKFGGGSDLGLWPLVWGTLYVSFIALVVAVPIGLMSAIYLAEYASPRIRSIVKPAIEILAGIPTIVYGLFALITVGPLLRDWIAQPMGFGDSASSVMTAGLVMGIMVIPFVSSLSDDIINAVPQSLRDGSLAIGATPSETVRQVVIPAALPGIAGAVLLAASRAIGETMIVVMGAGAAAKLSLNPFDAMTTVTVKIVSQLTGDTEFASPETLVAFALGLTLFTITLCLNIIALVIVRKYREQYE